MQDLGSTPYVLVGTINQMVEQLQRQAEAFDITRYVVREPAINSAAQIISMLDRP